MEKFRQALFELVREYGKQLPPEAVFYVFKDVYRDLAEDYKLYLQEVEEKEKIKEQTEEVKEG